MHEPPPPLVITATSAPPGSNGGGGDLVTLLDIEGYQGDDRSIVIPLDRADGNPLPLLGSGWGAVAHVRKHPTPMSPLLHQWTTRGEQPRARFVRVAADGTTIPDTAAGESGVRYGVELLCDDSEQWQWCGIAAGWDLVLADPTGRRQPVVSGHAYWHPTYTWAGAR